MASDSFAVDPRTAFVIYRAEMQKYAVIFPALRQGESPVIPEGIDETVIFLLNLDELFCQFPLIPTTFRSTSKSHWPFRLIQASR
jgi:hypothetical protein